VGQFLLIPNRINKFMDLKVNYSTSTLISSAGILSLSGDLFIVSSSVAILLYFSLPNIVNPVHIQ